MRRSLCSARFACHTAAAVVLPRGFFIAGAADVGGFGVASDHTWKLLGTLGYQFSDWFSAGAGYRRLTFDNEDGGFVWNVELSGPIVGATIRFWTGRAWSEV